MTEQPTVLHVKRRHRQGNSHTRYQEHQQGELHAPCDIMLRSVAACLWQAGPPTTSPCLPRHTTILAMQTLAMITFNFHMRILDSTSPPTCSR
jgi:hypothetical protein